MKYYRRLGVLNFLTLMLLMHEYQLLESPKDSKLSKSSFEATNNSP